MIISKKIIISQRKREKKSRCQTAIAFNLAYKTQRKKRERKFVYIELHIKKY